MYDIINEFSGLLIDFVTRYSLLVARLVPVLHQFPELKFEFLDFKLCNQLCMLYINSIRNPRSVIRNQ